MKSKVFAVAVQCWSGEEPQVVFYRRGPGYPYPDWMQIHKIRTQSSAWRLERLMKDGEPWFASPNMDDIGQRFPGHVSMFLKTDPEFWEQHAAAVATWDQHTAAVAAADVDGDQTGGDRDAGGDGVL